MNILVLAPLHKDNFEKMKNALPQHSFTFTTNKDLTQKQINNCDIIVGNPSFRFDFNKPHIKAILLNSAGSDAYVKKGLLHPNTILTNASGTYGKAIAEHTIGMILALNKNFIPYINNMQKHLWQSVSTGKELYHSTVIIVGLGDLGYEIAKRLKAFECHVIGVKRTMSSSLEHIDELYTIDQLDTLLPRADFIISALPQSPQTIHIFDKKRFLLMKKDAIFVNIGRGSAVKTSDLKEVLKSGHLYGVALDVTEEEPLPLNDELWDIDNVLITPHASGGYAWASTRNYYTDLVIRNIQHLLNNETLENEVDFQTGYRKTITYR